jgi:hypothetical protein
MLRRNIDVKAEATKLASLSIVWGVGAAVAYLGLIHRAIDLINNGVQSSGLSTSFDSGLISYVNAPGSAATKSLTTIAVAALPFAIIAVLVLGFFGRVRPTLSALPAGMIVAAIVGLAGTVAIFIQVVNTAANRTQFIVALVTIVLISLLLRISRGVRQFYRSNPALVSTIIAVVTIAYLFLLNGANIPSILLSDIDVWLALVSFGIVLYSGINMVGLGARARRGR